MRQQNLFFVFEEDVFPFFILFFVLASVITTAVGLLPDNAFTVFYTGTFATNI